MYSSFAPFETHRNPAANGWWNDVYHKYIDCTLGYLGWWISWENSHLLSSVELPIDDGVNVDKVTETSYDRYIYENWLENESDYDENTNVTALKSGFLCGIMKQEKIARLNALFPLKQMIVIEY